MASRRLEDVVIRRAEPADVEALADAHRDSIRSIGPAFYAPEDVDAWQQGLTGQVYLTAMEHGEVFFVATDARDRTSQVLGFSSDFPVDGTVHGTSVYVRGVRSRCGIGTALLREAEAHAITRGAAAIQIEASLAGQAFYEANGYVETGRGKVRLASGYPIACVFMRKDLTARMRMAARS